MATRIGLDGEASEAGGHSTYLGKFRINAAFICGSEGVESARLVVTLENSANANKKKPIARKSFNIPFRSRPDSIQSRLGIGPSSVSANPATR
jgi:hypothetical protein